MQNLSMFVGFLVHGPVPLFCGPHRVVRLHRLLAVARGDAPVIARLAQGDAAETDAADAVRGAAVHVSAPVVTLHGADSATVAYNRKVVPPHADAADVTACSVGSEARTWQRVGGKWVCTGVTRGDGLLGGVQASAVAWQQL